MGIGTRVFRRRLPHFYRAGVPVFLTFRLRESLPDGRAFPFGVGDSGKAFACLDRMLDAAACGPRWLGEARIARVVVEVLWSRDGVDYDLHSWVIMVNHVHLLLTPSLDCGDLLWRMKGASARAANRVLGRSGAFWQEESFDRVVRDEAEFRRVTRYIEMNPVRAGLVERAEDYRWSSLAGLKPGAG